MPRDSIARWIAGTARLPGGWGAYTFNCGAGDDVFSPRAGHTVGADCAHTTPATYKSCIRLGAPRGGPPSHSRQMTDTLLAAQNRRAHLAGDCSTP